MTYQLRDYQKSASDAAVSVFKSKEKKNYVIVLPTGAGKSLVIANIAARIDGPLIVFQPSKEILEQKFCETSIIRHIRLWSLFSFCRKKGYQSYYVCYDW